MESLGPARWMYDVVMNIDVLPKARMPDPFNMSNSMSVIMSQGQLFA